jgi:hypothetical protein
MTCLKRRDKEKAAAAVADAEPTAPSSAAIRLCSVDDASAR